MTLGSIYNAYPNGRPSGLPTDIVDQLVQVKQYQLLVPIQNEINEESQKKDVYSNLDNQLVSLYQAASALKDEEDFEVYSTSVSDSSILSATASSSAHTGTYDIDVLNIAKSHNLLIGVDDANATTGVTLGISNPNDSSLIQDGVTLSFYHNGTEYTYTTDSNTTLSSLAEAINQDDNGVYASVINIGDDTNPQYILSLKTEDTGGGTHQITQDAAGTTEGVNLSDTLFAGVTTEQETAQAGEDAELVVDGVNYSRSSNEISDIISGVTLTLTSTGSATLSVTNNISAITQQVQNFVTAYNNFDTFMDQNASYDAETKKAGPLLGDSIARTMQNNIRSILGSAVTGTGSNAYQYLSQIGITFQDDGSLKFDSTKFQEALENNFEDVKKLFTGDNGIATQLANAISTYTDSSTGIIPTTINNLEKKINDLNDKYQDAQEEVQDYEERMVKKYSALEEAVIKYKSIQETLESYIEIWKVNTKT